MTTDLTRFVPRVVTPGGIRSTVERVSPKLRASVLVTRDELTVLASEALKGMVWP